MLKVYSSCQRSPTTKAVESYSKGDIVSSSIHDDGTKRTKNTGLSHTRSPRAHAQAHQHQQSTYRHHAGFVLIAEAAAARDAGAELRPGLEHSVHALERALRLHELVFTHCSRPVRVDGASLPARRPFVPVEPRH